MKSDNLPTPVLATDDTMKIKCLQMARDLENVNIIGKSKCWN